MQYIDTEEYIRKAEEFQHNPEALATYQVYAIKAALEKVVRETKARYVPHSEVTNNVHETDAYYIDTEEYIRKSVELQYDSRALATYQVYAIEAALEKAAEEIREYVFANQQND